MFQSECLEFPSAPYLARKKTWWQLASPCWWNRARPWHVSELVSFLVGLRTYQHPGKHRYQNLCRGNTKIYVTRSLLKSSSFQRRRYRSPYWRAILHQPLHVLFTLRCTAATNRKGCSADHVLQLAGRVVGEYVTRCGILRCDGQPYTHHTSKKNEILSRRLNGNFWNIHPISLTLSRPIEPLWKYLEILPVHTIMGKWKWLFVNSCETREKHFGNFALLAQ